MTNINFNKNLLDYIFQNEVSLTQPKNYLSRVEAVNNNIRVLSQAPEKNESRLAFSSPKLKRLDRLSRCNLSHWKM